MRAILLASLMPLLSGCEALKEIFGSMSKASILVTSLLLSGCTAANVYTNEAIDAGRQAKDLEAKLLVNALCAMGIGALVRSNSDDVIEGVLLICANSGLTMEDINEARERDEAFTRALSE